MESDSFTDGQVRFEDVQIMLEPTLYVTARNMMEEHFLVH